MQTYARIVNGVVEEIIGPMTDEEGKEIAISDRFHPLIVDTLVDVAMIVPMPSQGWTYDGKTFSAPASP